MPARKPLMGMTAGFAAALLAGCSAGSSSRLAVRPEAAVATPTTLAVTQVVERTNANAAQVERLRADSGVSIAGGNARPAGLKGYIAIERPHNFKILLRRAFDRPVLDLGSNDQKFWFWTSEGREQPIYVGEFDSGGTIPAEVAFQPDWIVEALGLRAIPESEAAQIQAEPGTEPGTYVLTHLRPDGRGGLVRKQTVVNRQNGLPTRHIYYANDQRTILADVYPSEYGEFTEDEADSDSSLDTSVLRASTPKVILPRRIQVRLNPASPQAGDRMTADIKLSEIQVNPAFSPDNRQAFFTVPTDAHPGHEVRPFFETPVYASGAEPESRSSRPAPEPAAGPTLGEPQPIGLENADLLRDDPMPLDADLSAFEGPNAPGAIGSSIVRPGFPSLPGESQPTARVARSGILGTGFDR